MNWKEIAPKMENLQAGIVTEMRNLANLAAQNDNLPKPSSSFMAAKDMIEHPSYNVVVCGEVKKGKSSLLNAIVGQEILPVNNEIATSQVFRITNSSKESFALVFTDGTKMTISREELARYGSQVDATLETQEIFKEHTLSYIEVNIPVAFLPDGVSLVDTPGLGALYKSHEWITQNYVKKASAVIFVMDPERPLVEKEKDFILKVLDITPHILFVMTKIDMYTEDDCEKIIARNEELLALIFAEKNMKAPRIYPVSSTALMNASVGKVEALRASNYRNSHFPEMKEQLFLLSYKAIGSLRAGMAIQEIRNFFGKAKTVIEDMLKVTAAENAQEQMRVNTQKQELQNRMRSEVGVDSRKWNETKDNIAAICNSVTSRVQQMVSTSGNIFRHYEQLIDKVDSGDALKRLHYSIERDLNTEIDQQWHSIVEDTREKVNAELYEYNLQIESEETSNGVFLDRLYMRKLSIKDYLPSFQRAFWITGTISGILTSIFGPIGLLSIPIVGTITFNLFWTEDKKRQCKQALVDAFNEIGKNLLHVQGNANRSLVGEFSYQLMKSAEAAMRNNIDAQQEQFKQEMANLEAQARLNAEKRQQQHNLWQQVKNDWSKEAERINQVILLHKEIESSINQ